jgi:nucleoside-diphosphate-sugar epimerase
MPHLSGGVGLLSALNVPYVLIVLFPYLLMAREVIGRVRYRAVPHLQSSTRLAFKRDWGWAPEYVDAMWRMLQQSTGSDFVIATGESHTLEEFAQTAFGQVGLDWREHTDLSEALRRPSDLAEGCGDASRAREVLGWSATFRMSDVVKAMVEAERVEAERL